MRCLRTLTGIALVLGFAAGCASSSPPASTPPAAPQATAPQPAQPPAAAPEPAATAPAPAAAQPSAQPAPAAGGGVTLREEKDVGQVWLAPGFDFEGYDTLLIAETRTDVPKLNPDGVANVEWARGVLRNELVAAIQERKLLTVVTNPADVKPGSRVLRLDNTIIEYEKGGGGARFFAGGYGAGHPVIKVRGELKAADRPLFVYEARRSSVSVTARIFGGYRSDKAIQEEDIKHLTRGVGDFMVRTKGP
jgi:hypothetical protein